MYRDELFEKVWKILFSDKKDQVDCSDPEIRGIIRRMKRTLTTTEPDYKSMWKKLQVEQQRRRLKLFVRWSAAVILPVLVLSVSYLWRNEEPSLTSMRLAENAPEGVRLILSDSSVVSLQARQHFEIVDDERMNVGRTGEQDWFIRNGVLVILWCVIIPWKFQQWLIIRYNYQTEQLFI